MTPGSLSLAAGLLVATVGLAGCGRAQAQVVQLDISADFNADVVVNDGSGTYDPTQDPVDSGIDVTQNFCFPTQSVAESAAVPPQTPDGLPDGGFFPADAFHPGVRLSWNNNDDGLNAWRLESSTGQLVLMVPPSRYVEVHVHATSGQGSCDITLTPSYSDGLGTAVPFVVPDWFAEIVPTQDTYYLIDNMDRIQPGSGPGMAFEFQDRNDPAIFGFRLLVDSARQLESVLLDRTDTSGVLNVFGGLAVEPSDPEACCFADGGCADLISTDCSDMGGLSQGPGTDCAGTACALPGIPGWVPDGARRPGDALHVSRAMAGQLALAWGRGCSPDATDHVVYEGTIGNGYDHLALLCDTAGALVSATITPGAGARYYVIVAITDDDEGSYGLDSFGVERPASATLTCRATVTLGCP